MLIGLDVSTTTVGITALADDGKLLGVSHVSLGKIPADEVGRKGDLVRKALSVYVSLVEEHGPAKVFIESPVKRFSPKFSNADTISKLARFNGVVSFIAYDVYGSEAISVTPAEARKKVGVILRKAPKGTKHHVKKKMTKEDVIAFVLESHTPDEVGFKKTRYENWYNWCGDRADSYVIAKYGTLV